jgi:hypothetical protein
MTIQSVRTVRASVQTPRVSSSTPAPVTPFDAALRTFVKSDAAPESEEGLSALRALASVVPSSERTDACTSAISDAEKALKGMKGERDSLVSLQRRAVRRALQKGYKGIVIAAELGVSTGTVSAVKGGLDLAAALTKGGMETKQLPSADSLVSRVQTASKVKGGRAALLSTAKATGTLPEDGDVKTFTAAQALSAVQKATDAVKHIVRADGDADTFNALLTALATLNALNV